METMEEKVARTLRRLIGASVEEDRTLDHEYTEGLAEALLACCEDYEERTDNTDGQEYEVTRYWGDDDEGNDWAVELYREI